MKFKSALFSDCRTYRYALSRIWGSEDNLVMFVGLNPSTANETEDDPTIRRCIGFAKLWGYEGIAMTNLFAYRSTDPNALLLVPDPIGPRNDEWLGVYAGHAKLIVAAWGSHPIAKERSKIFDPRSSENERLQFSFSLKCLGRTKSGFPRHPLYLRSDTKLEDFYQVTK